MSATEIPDEILDWHIGYWQGCATDYISGVEFACRFTRVLIRPDNRCLTGIRISHEPCHHQFRSWSTIRELIKIVQEHVQESHPENMP